MPARLRLEEVATEHVTPYLGNSGTDSSNNLISNDSGLTDNTSGQPVPASQSKK